MVNVFRLWQITEDWAAYKWQKFISHHFGGWKPEIGEPVWLGPCEYFPLLFIDSLLLSVLTVKDRKRELSGSSMSIDLIYDGSILKTLYPHLSKNFHSILWCTVKGFSIVNEAKVDAIFFWILFAFSMTQQMLAIWSLPFLNPAYLSGSSLFTYCCSLPWKI